MELLILTFIILLIMVIILSLFYITPRLSGAVFQATGEDKVEKIVSLAESNLQFISADLGSGDGRIVIALAKKGIEAHGFEINPFLVLYSRWKIKKEKIQNAQIHWKSFWKEDFSKYDLITLFQTGKIMDRLGNKIKKESPNARVISYYWKFPQWQPTNNLEDVYLYLVDKDE